MNHIYIRTIVYLATICVLHSLTTKSFADDVTNAKPNIVAIMTDDLGYSDLRYYGSETKTPNLDTLAANGVRSS